MAAPLSAASTSPSLRTLRCGGCFESSAAFVGEARAALRRRRAFVPRDLELLARLLNEPPVVADDRDARHEAHQAALRAALDDERVLDARLALDLVEVRAHDLAGEHRALHETRVEHSRHRDVDAEHRLAADDVAHVDAGDRACR